MSADPDPVDGVTDQLTDSAVMIADTNRNPVFEIVITVSSLWRLFVA